MWKDNWIILDNIKKRRLTLTVQHVCHVCSVCSSSWITSACKIRFKHNRATQSLLMLIAAVELINMVIYAHGPRSQGADPQWHTLPEMSYGTNKMAPEASQLDGNTSVSVSGWQGGHFGCWRAATAPAGWKYMNHYSTEEKKWERFHFKNIPVLMWGLGSGNKQGKNRLQIHKHFHVTQLETEFSL